VVLPISDRHLDYGRGVLERLKAAGLRAELDDRQEKIGYKIREAQLQKVPYMLVVGDRESADGAVSVRTRKGGDQGSQALPAFIDRALAEVRDRAADPELVKTEV
jgi:threonyl-tRNA synthetase